MTPGEKLNLLHVKGKKWGEIASILGVSRQFLTRVRRGVKNLSSGKMKILDDLVSVYDTQNGAHQVVRELHPSYDPHDRLPDPDLARRIETLELDVALLKKIILTQRK